MEMQLGSKGSSWPTTRNVLGSVIKCAVLKACFDQEKASKVTPGR